jgi:tetratricopeptide (TPR) repeat protein
MGFVGRGQEMDRLEREVALAFELATGRSVFIQGPPGAGKTTLATEFVRQLHARFPEARIARGRCLQTFGSADPYLPFVDALRDLSDEGAGGGVRRESLSAMLTELAPYWLQVVPMVGNLLSAGFATAARLRGEKAGDAAPSREALFVQYLELIRRLAAQGPLLLFLDDLHWADHSSVALLSHLARGVATLPVLIIATLRADDAELEKHPITGLIRELERESLGVAINLGEMDPGSLRELLAAELEGDVSEPLHRWVAETAGGNPLFATELARLLKQSGAAAAVRGEWRLTEGAEQLELPRSAEAVIETRIQHLDAEEVKLLQYASVQGNDFDSVVLAQLLGQDELEVLDALERIERHHKLVRTTGEQALPNGDVSTTLRFHHALVQTVLYRQVLGKRRILLHRKAGEILESLHAGKTGEIAGRLAGHFHEGRLPEPAHRYAALAADSARRAYAHWEAVKYFGIALEHAPDEEERLRLHERLGDVYVSLGYYDRAESCFQEALALPVAEDTTRLRLRRKGLEIERKVGREPAPVLLGRLRALAGEAADAPEERCWILLRIALIPVAQNVVPMLEEAVAIAESLKNPPLLAEALEQLAVARIMGGDPQRGLEPLARAFEIGGGESDPFRAGRYYNILGIAHSKLGQYRQTLQAFERMLAAMERMAHAHGVGVACNNLGCELLKMGEYDRAEEVLQRARVIHERHDRASLAQSSFNLAKRAHWSGDFPLALERYAQLREYAREFGYWSSEAVAEAGLGLCHLELGAVEEARADAGRAAAQLADHDEWFEDREFVEILLAHLQALDGDPRAGAERLGRAAATIIQADFFAWVQVELERVRITRDFDAARAREVMEEVVAATRGVEFALDGEIDTLRRQLGTHRALATPPPA